MDEMVKNGIDDQYKKVALPKLIDFLKNDYSRVSEVGRMMMEQYPDLTPEQINDLYEELCEVAERKNAEIENAEKGQ